MTDHLGALLASIQGAPVLDPADVAAAVVEAERHERVGEIAAALATKPNPKIPPRYESEIRTWLARSIVDTDPQTARLQAYAAVHLDPHNSEAIAALDRSLDALGDEVRKNTWSALVHSYPEVPSMRDAATLGGVTSLPSPRPRTPHRQRAKPRPTDAVLVDAGEGSEHQEAEAQVIEGRPKRGRGKRPKGTGIAGLVPALEPDPVKADRLAVLHIVAGVSWDETATDEDEELDPLSWAQLTLQGKGVEAPKQAIGTRAVISLFRGVADSDGDVRPGPRYGRIIRRLKNHPAVIIWSAARQIDAGDLDGARRAMERLDDASLGLFVAEKAEIDRKLAIVDGDLEAGWAAWEGGELPLALRSHLARALLAAGRDSDADEVLGLPEVPAGVIDDPGVLELRFEVVFADGDVEEAIEQAERLIEVSSTPAHAIGRLWLALATCGRLTDLATRAEADTARIGATVSEVVDSLLPDLEERTRGVTEHLVSGVAELRVQAQSMAKGRTIRNEAYFGETAGNARKSLEELDTYARRIGDLEPGDYPISDEDIVRFLASASGRHAELADDKVRVDEAAAPADVMAHPAVAALTEPARELQGRGPLIHELLGRAADDIEAAVSESRRTDIARRRLEERVSKRARAAADDLSILIEALDVFSPVPDVPAHDGDAGEADAPERAAQPGMSESAAPAGSGASSPHESR